MLKSLLLASLLVSAAVSEKSNALETPVAAAGASATGASLSDAPNADEAPSHVSHTHESSEFMCKICGATLFHTEDHIPGMVLNGPRVARAKAEPSLGAEGTLWELTRSGGPGSVTTALFNVADSNIKFGVQSEHPAFAEFRQKQAVCGKCGNPVGWHFERANAHPKAPFRQGTDATGSAAATPSAPVHPRSANKDTAGKAAKAGAASGSRSTGSAASGSTGTKAAPPAAKGTPASRELADLAVIPHVDGEEDDTLASLDGQCLTLPKGWWNFQWCHKQRVNQFHREPDGTVGPDWSLGEFDTRGKMERTRPISAAAGYYTSHFFLDGQRCDETGKGRATEVQFFCCPHVRQSAPHVEDVEEPAVCKYRMKICVPALCRPIREDTTANDGGAAPGGEEYTGQAQAQTQGHAPSAVLGAPGAVTATEGVVNHEGETAGNGQARGQENGAAAAGLAAPSPMATTSAAVNRAEVRAADAADATQQAATSSVPSPSAAPSKQPKPVVSRTPFPSPDKTYNAKALPDSFFAAAWSLLLGDQDPSYHSVAGGELQTGVPPVRFA